MSRKPFDPNLALGGQPPPPPRTSADAPLTVWQVTELVRTALEKTFPPTVHVAGQLSNVKAHGSGHVYFTLKDARSELAGVMWRSDAVRLKFKPADGLDVIAAGEISVFERTGRYQLYARSLEPRGLGALELAFRQLCAKLQAEGLFEPARKKRLPRYPRQIAIVTSPTGAALQDMLNTLQRRFPAAVVHLCPAPVQGPGSAEAIAHAIQTVNRRSAELGGIDVLIVGRGGGSIEDLWAFNEEVVARAIAASAIPTISAVGHETDVTIADFVADVRAATPTAAAELAVPDARELLDEIAHRATALTRLVRHRCELAAGRLRATSRRAAFVDGAALFRARTLQVDRCRDRMLRSVVERIHKLQRRVSDRAVVLQRLHPQSFFAAQERRVADAELSLRRVFGQRLGAGERALARAWARLARLTPEQRVANHQVRLAAVLRRLCTAASNRTQRAGGSVDSAFRRLQALSYKSTLLRGFTITRTKRGRHVVLRPQDVRNGDRIITEFAEGAVESRVTDERQGELFD
jgi:exodeoxyribonuclease VII large subunit